ncbi:conjugative transposon protein TraJ [Alistipes onderdonkii]|uniref:conjugative transposon protein TraJ n=1 Tax=Alistipes onderdonkii TaxID=328813 RepID=UPI0036F3B3ED
MAVPLVSFESLHELLGRLYDDMMELCDSMASVAIGIAGIGALLYISYRVWKALAQAEPIDVFPLLRPFALALCILLFQPLVLGTLNGILGVVVKGTHSLLTAQVFDMNDFQTQKDALENENLVRDMNMVCQTLDADYDKQIERLDWAPEEALALNAMQTMLVAHTQESFLTKIFRWLLEFMFKTASLIIDTIRTFYLVVLSILGPLAFAISVYDGFQATLSQWFCKYVSVYLWLPISDLFGALLARLQVLSLQKDLELMRTDPFYMFDSSNMVYLVFLAIGIFGYFTIPSIASWVVQANGFGPYNRMVTRAGSTVKNVITGSVGALAGNAWIKARTVQKGHDNNS